jgi:hypothetical protein
MENIRYEVCLQNKDKFVTQCTIVLIRKILPDLNFIEPIFFRIRTIAHCVTNKVVVVFSWPLYFLFFDLRLVIATYH